MITIKGEFEKNNFIMNSQADVEQIYDAIQSGEDFLLISKDSCKVHISNPLKSKLDKEEIVIQGRV